MFVLTSGRTGDPMRPNCVCYLPKKCLMEPKAHLLEGVKGQFFKDGRGIKVLLIKSPPGMSRKRHKYLITALMLVLSHATITGI